MNISHQNTGPDPPQLYGSSWEHGSWGRSKAKRGQVRLTASGDLSSLHCTTRAALNKSNAACDACPGSACPAILLLSSHHIIAQPGVGLSKCR